MRKDKRVMVRFSPQVHRDLVLEAKRQGVTISELVRALVTVGLSRVTKE